MFEVALHQAKASQRFDKPRSSREKACYITSVIRIEGINPFSGAVAGEAIFAILVRLVESWLISLSFVLALVYFFLIIENPHKLVVSLINSCYLKIQKN